MAGGQLGWETKRLGEGRPRCHLSQNRCMPLPPRRQAQVQAAGVRASTTCIITGRSGPTLPRSKTPHPSLHNLP